MPADAPDVPVRRSVVPPRAARSIWLAAAWTGAGAAGVCAVASIAAVAVCWLPASGSAGSPGSALRAGLLTFLAGVHGGITVDGVAAGFVPLGLTIVVGLLAWRAGTGLADVAADLDETEPGTILGAGLLQAGAFAFTCAIAGRLATLGTSSVPAFGVTAAAFALFLLTGGTALVRNSPVGRELVSLLPGWVPRAGRAGVAAVAVYLGGGALLAAASLAVHHDRVEALSAQVGGGWSGVPILLLGALAAPNAVIAGSSYLAGPGFAVGTGNGASLLAGGHGLLPAFPILGGVPSGPAGTWTWTLAALTFVLAGGCVAALVANPDAAEDVPGWAARVLDVVRAAALAGVIGAGIAWQGGGSIGSGRLATVGVSPWQLGVAFAALTFVGGSAGLGLMAAVRQVRGTAESHGQLRHVAARATAATDAATDRLGATRRVVEVADGDGDGGHRGFLRATLSSVAQAVTTTDDERAASEDEPATTDGERAAG